MARIQLPQGLQSEFLSNVSKAMNSDWDRVSRAAHVNLRTLFDWRREKYTMSYEALKQLSRLAKVTVPAGITILPEYWSVRKAGAAGGQRRSQLYGNPGTPEGRARGGRISQHKLSKDPEYARTVGFKIRNSMSYPGNSSLLAEFVGVVLGDGGITRNQVVISLNSKTEIAYSRFIKNTFFELFGVSPSVRTRERNSLNLIATGRNLVEFLLTKGLRIGDKVKQQVGVPGWILRDREFVKACLRGLIDTDGGVYFHTHSAEGIKYRHMGLCFTSYSRPLLSVVHNALVSLDMAAKIYKTGRVYIYNRDHIKKYFDEVGSHNSHHIKRFVSYRHSKDYN